MSFLNGLLSLLVWPAVGFAILCWITGLVILAANIFFVIAWRDEPTRWSSFWEAMRVGGGFAIASIVVVFLASLKIETVSLGLLFHPRVLAVGVVVLIYGYFTAGEFDIIS